MHSTYKKSTKISSNVYIMSKQLFLPESVLKE